jgi:uncharacterized surface protein with fasciclin (FAS1) repeats
LTGAVFSFALPFILSTATLCTAVQAAGLGDALSKGRWTVFAPTNEAFANLGDTLDAVLADTDLLTDILLFHAVDDVVGSDDLVCNTGGGNGLVEMANGQDSRTICERTPDGQAIFQKGGSNPSNAKPQIILTDIETCQGFIHVVNEVMLPGRLNIGGGDSAPAPAPAPEDCQTIAEIACGVDDFSTLCAAVTQAGLADALSEGEWTVFAPLNSAFAELGDTLDAVLGDLDLLTSILLFHAVDKPVFAEDLRCAHLIHMANGDDSRTVCHDNGNIFQKGAGNPRNNMPKIVDADIGACNGTNVGWIPCRRCIVS